jgi:hypothetical protein
MSLGGATQGWRRSCRACWQGCRVAQVGGQWIGGGDGMGSGLDFDGAVAAGGAGRLTCTAAREMTASITYNIGLDRPGDLGGSDPWKDAESCLHSGSTPMSCANAR